MLECLQAILNEPWKPVSRPALVAWLIFYVAFLAYAFSAHGAFLFIDNANLVVHEGGHNLFGWFGPTLGLWGGTLLQWLVPFLLAAYFFMQRQTTGFVFCLLFFFENWLYTATYMADARTQALPLVTTGDSDFVEHDFYTIFSGLGVLNYDTRIAVVVRLLGWCGMIACVVWLGMKGREENG
jgi:magnesium-transporting ATPase (P-type)